jgi:hypothetical protein
MVLPGMALTVGSSRVIRDVDRWSVAFDVQIEGGGAAISAGRISGI